MSLCVSHAEKCFVESLLRVFFALFCFIFCLLVSFPSTAFVCECKNSRNEWWMFPLEISMQSPNDDGLLALHALFHGSACRKSNGSLLVDSPSIFVIQKRRSDATTFNSAPAIVDSKHARFDGAIQNGKMHTMRFVLRIGKGSEEFVPDATTNRLFQNARSFERKNESLLVPEIWQ